VLAVILGAIPWLRMGSAAQEAHPGFENQFPEALD
jgi:hypothetical protein